MNRPTRRDLLSLFPLALAERLTARTGVTFTDVAAAAGLGLAKNISGLARNKQFLLEEMGGGVALFDYDNDGWLDIFLVNGTAFEPSAGKKPTGFLFHNNRDGTFKDVTEKARLTYCGWGQGCCVGDYDNDGFDDLFVSYWGRNVFYHNNGDGTFTDVTETAGLLENGAVWGAGCCFLDYDRDGHLDLFCASYVNFDPAQTPKPGEAIYCRYKGIPVPCGPQGFSGGSNRLYRNRGDGTFENVSVKSGIANPRGRAGAAFTKSNWRPVGAYGMGAAAADFDNDGWPDIYVASDTAPSLLYRNNRDGTFREIAVEAGCAFDENGAALSGMGVAVGDYDGDGWLDIARTNFSGQVTAVYRNDGVGGFRDASLETGLGANRKYLGFGAVFADFDNDGWEDLFVANGHVYSQLADRGLYLDYKEPKLLYRNLGNGHFEDISARSGPGIGTPSVSRGCAFGDLDNDGNLDIVVNNLDAPPSVLRNAGGNSNNWLMVKCVGSRSNRSAIGTRLRLTASGRTQIREVMSGSSYYSHNDMRVHFGLGAARRVDRLEVAWPSGAKQAIEGIEANRLLRIEERKG
jgi:hypothetical protein